MLAGCCCGRAEVGHWGAAGGTGVLPLLGAFHPAGAQREAPASLHGKKDGALNPGGQRLAGFSSCEKPGSGSDHLHGVVPHGDVRAV